MEFSSNENYQAFRDNDSSDNRSSFQSSKKDYNSQQRKRFTWKCVCFARKACSSLLFFIIWAAIFIVSYPDVNNNIIYSISGSTPFKIVLFGDSLVNVGCLYFDLAEKLQHQFPNYPLTIVNAGVNNDMIADLKARMYTDVVDLQPDAVIIYWDSDVSDQLVYVLDEQSTLSQYSVGIRLYIFILHVRTYVCMLCVYYLLFIIIMYVCIHVYLCAQHCQITHLMYVCMYCMYVCRRTVCLCSQPFKTPLGTWQWQDHPFSPKAIYSPWTPTTPTGTSSTR